MLLEHRDFIIVNKPIGIHMHDAEIGITQLLSRQLQITTLYLVHRLDTPTSGCLVLATNKSSAAYLSSLFENRQIEKFYLALIDNKPKKKQGTIIGDMINRRSGQRALLRSKDNPAITQFLTYSLEPSLRMALVKPVTGKTHQIRVALKSLGAPIIGDDRYGGTPADRLYLHAWHIRFKYHDEDIVCYAKPEKGDFFNLRSTEDWLDTTPPPEKLNWPQTQHRTNHPIQ